MGYSSVKKSESGPYKDADSYNMDTTVKELVASDLSRFDRRKLVRDAVEEEQVSKKAAPKPVKHAKISLITLMYYVFAVAISGALLLNYVNLTVLTDEASSLKKQYETLKGQETHLQTEYDKRLNLKDIEAYAINQLGMIKMERSQVEYIELTNPDSITMVAPQDAPRLSYYLAGLVRSFNAALEFFK